MNNDILTLWLWVSGIFFLLGILLFAGALVALFKVLKVLEEVKPKVDSLTVKVERLVVKTEVLVVKLERVADTVEETMQSVKHSAEGVGGKAEGIMGTVETFTKGASSRIPILDPILAGAMAAYKIFLTIKAARAQAHAKAKPSAKALPGKK